MASLRFGSGRSGYDEYFDPPLESKHECPICHLGLREPVQISCGHRFCRGCIVRSVWGVVTKCPVDDEPLSKQEPYPDKFAQREMMSHDVFCRMKKQCGCPWKGPLGKLEEHLNKCPFVNINCPNECGKKLQRKDLPQHLEKDCPLKTVPCKYCTKDVLCNALEEHLLKDCPSPFADISCPNKCGERLQKKDLVQHLEKDCRFTLCIRSGKYCTAKNMPWDALESMTGFGVLEPCGRIDHNACVKCPVSKGQMSYSNIECNRGGDSLTFKKSSKKKKKPKDSMTIEVEKPWPDDKRDPKHQKKLTVDEKHGKATISSREFPSVNPTPSSSFPTKANGAATQRIVSSDSEGSVSASVDRLGKSIGPSLTPDIPAERQSPPKVQHTKATEKPEFHINTGEPPRTEEYRRHKGYGVEAKRGMPTPRNKTSSRSLSSGDSLWALLTLFFIVAISALIGVILWRHFKETKVSLANVTEASRFSPLGSDSEPVTEIHCRCIYQQVGGKWKDVLRNLSMAEVAIERLDLDYSKVAEKFYQGLLAWSRGTQGATTKKLCEALHLAGCSEALEKLSRVSLANATEASRFSSLDSDNEPVTEIHCRCINQQVGGKWKDVLRNLSIAEVAIENADEDNSTVAEKFYQGLLAWSRGTQGATTKKLCEALHLAGCSEALETLSSEGVTSDAPSPIPESTVDLGTWM